MVVYGDGGGCGVGSGCCCGGCVWCVCVQSVSLSMCKCLVSVGVLWCVSLPGAWCHVRVCVSSPAKNGCVRTRK